VAAIFIEWNAIPGMMGMFFSVEAENLFQFALHWCLLPTNLTCAVKAVVSRSVVQCTDSDGDTGVGGEP